MNLFTAHKKIFSSSEKGFLLRNSKGFILRNSKGFTLIELLVVIGILGILAASLVATIDPFQQLKKANDAKVQNAAVEFQTATVRYFAAQNAFPWENSSTANATCKATDGGTGDISDPTLLTDSGMSACLDDLIASGELKSGFKDVTGVLDKVYVTETVPVAGGSSVVQVCYLPTSLSGQKDKATKYIPNPLSGTPTSFTADSAGTTCISGGTGTQNCYWCTQ
jgi:prepilin-type N-terminal cleavage/methylation domain-containing protein